MKKINIYLLCLLYAAGTQPAKAQMPDDGFTMDKGIVCTVLGYSQSSWTHYWEGTRYKDNLNIGTFTSKAVMPMLAYGITNKLNVFASLPYISNSSSAGTLTGKKGMQDFSLEAKYKVYSKQKKQLNISLFAGAGFSLPSNKYVPDFLPYSIGLGSKTATARIIAHTVFKEHVFFTAQAAYTAKSNITVDRITYYSDGQRYTNEMRVPNMWSGSVRAGYDNSRFRADVFYQFGKSETGSDIRANDMPLPVNKMNMQAIGFNGLFWVPKLNGLGVLVSAKNTIDGRNVGKAFTWMTGLQYFFTPFKKKQHAKA
jgi:hypothetical protein